MYIAYPLSTFYDDDVFDLMCSSCTGLHMVIRRYLSCSVRKNFKKKNLLNFNFIPQRCIGKCIVQNPI